MPYLPPDSRHLAILGGTLNSNIWNGELLNAEGQPIPALEDNGLTAPQFLDEHTIPVP